MDVATAETAIAKHHAVKKGILTIPIDSIQNEAKSVRFSLFLILVYYENCM